MAGGGAQKDDEKGDDQEGGRGGCKATLAHQLLGVPLACGVLAASHEQKALADGRNNGRLLMWKGVSPKLCIDSNLAHSVFLTNPYF